MIPHNLKQYKNKGIIYGLIDPNTKLLRYIGKSIIGIQRAFEHYKNSSIKEGNTPKNNWIKKLKNNNQIYEVLVLFSVNKEEYNKIELNNILYLKEQDLIKENKLKYNLLNLADGGPGAPGVKFSDKSRKKMSDSAKKRNHDHLRKLAESQKNSPEKVAQKKQERKLKLKLRNRKIAGSKFLYSISRGKKVIAKDINGNEIVAFYNLRGAAKTLGGRASHTGLKIAIKNKTQYYGYFWEFI